MLHAFTGGNDGAYPFGGPTLDRAGSLYGTTEKGGPNDAGTVFKITPGGTFTQLYSFTGGSDGDFPQARLQIIKGVLYGTTFYGGKQGQGYGTIFKILADGTIIVLHTFTNADGASSYAGLTEGKHGVLYGATAAGGANGFGVVFSVTKK